MKVDHHKAWSPNLDQEMELNVYGEAGKPILVFPTRGGRYYDYEGFGMVEACRPFIGKGGIRMFAEDSVDFQSWLNEGIHPADRARRHNPYDRYIVDELPIFRTSPIPGTWTGAAGGASSYAWVREPGKRHSSRTRVNSSESSKRGRSRPGWTSGGMTSPTTGRGGRS